MFLYLRQWLVSLLCQCSVVWSCIHCFTLIHILIIIHLLCFFLLYHSRMIKFYLCNQIISLLSIINPTCCAMCICRTILWHSLHIALRLHDVSRHPNCTKCYKISQCKNFTNLVLIDNHNVQPSPCILILWVQKYCIMQKRNKQFENVI